MFRKREKERMWVCVHVYNEGISLALLQSAATDSSWVLATTCSEKDTQMLNHSPLKHALLIGRHM